MKNAVFMLLAAAACGCSVQDAPVVKPQVKTPAKQAAAAEAAVIAAQAQARPSSGRSNPFLSIAEESSLLGQESAVELSWPVIDGIIYAPSAGRVIVGASVLGIGDELDGKQIVRIEPEAVYVRGKQGEYVIRLRNVQ